jgi:hypothetical protein
MGSHLCITFLQEAAKAAFEDGVGFQAHPRDSWVGVYKPWGEMGISWHLPSISFTGVANTLESSA